MPAQPLSYRRLPAVPARAGARGAGRSAGQGAGPDLRGQVRPDSFRFEAIPHTWVPFLPSALLPFLRSLSIGPFQRIFGLFLLDFLNSGILSLSC